MGTTGRKRKKTREEKGDHPAKVKSFNADKRRNSARVFFRCLLGFCIACPWLVTCCSDIIVCSKREGLRGGWHGFHLTQR
mmetsp:Transcript_12835/g.31487  ORF Transcript_12835/g.31487 Transcript_12835/m.31487 type:complete len:80 (+) Transcript_12835:672-911(+)